MTTTFNPFPCGEAIAPTPIERKAAEVVRISCDTFGEEGNREAEAAADKAMRRGALSIVKGRNVSAFLWQVWLKHTAYNKRVAAEDAAREAAERSAQAVVDLTPPAIPAGLTGLYLFVDTEAESNLRAVQMLHESPYYKLSMFRPITSKLSFTTLNDYSIHSQNKNSPQELYSIFLIVCPAAKQSVYKNAAIELLSDEWHAKHSVIIVSY